MTEIGQSQGRHGQKALRGSVAVAATVAAMGVLYWGYTSRLPSVQAPGARQAWYYDPGTGKLFTAMAGVLPVAKAPSGASGVLAHVFACGECGVDGAKQWVGYLERVPDEMAAKWRSLQPAGGGPPPNPESVVQTAKGLYDVTQATEYAAPTTPDTWANYLSDAGNAIRKAATNRCEGEPIKECLP